MYTRERSLYRPEAVQRYLATARQGVVPRLGAPRVLLVLWLLLGLLFMAGALAGFATVPIYVSGRAVVLPDSDASGASPFAVVAFLPPEALADLRVGQRALVQFSEHGVRAVTVLTRVLSDVVSPAAARQRFGLDGGTAAAIARPAAVAVARVTEWPISSEPAGYVSGVYPVQIEVGTRRLLTFLLFATRAD